MRYSIEKELKQHAVVSKPEGGLLQQYEGTP